MVFKKLVITCDNSGSVPKTRVIVDDVDFSENLTQIKFGQRAGNCPTLLLEIALKGENAGE